MNENIETAIPRLVWVKALTEGRLALPRDADYETFKVQRYRADALLNQIDLKLDYYGQYYNSVPLLHVDEYIVLLRNLLEAGKDIESSYIAYDKALENNIHDKESLAQTIDITISRNSRPRTSLNLIQTNQASIETTIAKLNDQLNSIWVQLFQAAHDFKVDVESHKEVRVGQNRCRCFNNFIAGHKWWKRSRRGRTSAARASKSQEKDGEPFQFRIRGEDSSIRSRRLSKLDQMRKILSRRRSKCKRHR